MSFCPLVPCCMGLVAACWQVGCQLVSGLDDLEAVGGDAASGADTDGAAGDRDAKADRASASDGPRSADGRLADGARDGHGEDGAEGASPCGPTDTIQNCGECGVSCDTLTAATESCVAASCSYACLAGRSNCDVTPPNTGGCECATPGCCGIDCQSTHSNGVGQSFYDCVPPGTFTEAEAAAACLASTGSASECGAPTCGFTTAVCSVGSSSDCICWSYSGATAGRVHTATQPGSLNCACPTTTDPKWY